MRKQILLGIGCIALAMSGTAMAQGRSGGGPGGGRGAGPPITPPGSMGGGAGTADFARGIGSERGQFGRDFGNQQRMSASDRILQAEPYRQSAQQRRAEAQMTAHVAHRGAPLTPNDGKRIREALKDDMNAWRETFQVGRTDWQAMRNQWLLDREALTPQQWAQQRAQWFAARDAWISSQKGWASNQRR